MPVHNADIAAVFDEIADLLEIQGENPFRVRAYRNASRTIGDFGTSIAALVQSGAQLEHMRGVGEDLAAKIREIAATGTCELLLRLRHEMPPAITALLQVQGLGPKRVHALYEALRLDSVEALLDAAKAGRVRELPGFGEKSEAQIVERIEAHLHKARRFKLAFARQYADPLLAHLRATSPEHVRVPKDPNEFSADTTENTRQLQAALNGPHSAAGRAG